MPVNFLLKDQKQNKQKVCLEKIALNPDSYEMLHIIPY